MRRALILLWMGILAGTAAADPISVRSGDHGTFTRLAFDLPQQMTWQVNQDGREVTVEIAGHQNGFDYAAVFDRIDRERVQDIRPDGLGLIIVLGCDCGINSFSVSSTMKAIDISERIPVAQAPAAARPIIPQGDTSTVTPSDPFTIDTALPTGLAGSPVPPFRQTGGPGSAPVDLIALQSELAQEIASAATQGVLDPSRRQNVLPPEPASSPSGVPETRLPVAIPPGPTRQTNIRVSSSLDAPDQSLGPRRSDTERDAFCIGPDAFRIENWGSEQRLSVQLASHRRVLYDNRDRLQPDAAKALARTYLHFGFGPEALRVLELDRDLQRKNGVLIEIGEILEYGHVRSPQVLHRFLECSGAAAMWAILGSDRLDPAAVVDIDSALLALNRLPLHLREILAPNLSRRLLDFGDRRAADAALRSIERSADAVTGDGQLARAALDLAAGDSDAGQRRLAKVMNSNTAQSAQALIEYVDAKLSEEQPVSGETADLVEAYLKELRGGPLEPDLQRARVLSLAQSGQFDAAFDALQLHRSASDVQTGLRKTVFQRLTADASDIVFLDHVLNAITQDGLPNDPETRLAASDRLLGLGFASEADRVMQSDVPDFSAATARRLKARIALALRKPALAQAHLLGLSSAEDLRIVAKAQQMAGDQASASETYASVGDALAAERAALLSETWQTRLPAEAPRFGPLAAIAETPLNVSSAPSGMLARSQSVLDESVRARSLLRDLILDN